MNTLKRTRLSMEEEQETQEQGTHEQDKSITAPPLLPMFGREAVLSKSIFYDEREKKMQNITQKIRQEANLCKNCIEVTITNLSDETGHPVESSSLPSYVFREFEYHEGVWHRYVSQKVFLRQNNPVYSKTKWYNEHGRVETINYQFAALDLVLQIDLDDEDEPVYASTLYPKYKIN